MFIARANGAPVANRDMLSGKPEPKMPKITCEVYKDPRSAIFVVLCKHGDDVIMKFAVRSQEESEAALVRALRQLHENSFTLGTVTLVTRSASAMPPSSAIVWLN
jgi:glycosylphosphatidylinositol transamidase (GPIT) subunit GPI8